MTQEVTFNALPAPPVREYRAAVVKTVDGGATFATVFQVRSPRRAPGCARRGPQVSKPPKPPISLCNAGLPFKTQ
jgi:hypothetical protein